MGRSHLNNFQQHDDVQVVTVCDVWEVNRRRAQRMTERQKTGAASVEADFRRVVERTDLDAVVVATSDHWHAIPMILACQSGKDVYVEKPLSLSVAEGRAMVRAARHYKRVTQVGLHRRDHLLHKPAPPISALLKEIGRGGARILAQKLRNYDMQDLARFRGDGRQSG